MNEREVLIVNDIAHDPLECKDFPSMNRLEVRNYVSMEPKMCENCDRNFLRVIGTSLRYCTGCRAGNDQDREFLGSTASLNSRERAASQLP